jgi:electron transfer flavoprotein alpha subunit
MKGELKNMAYDFRKLEDFHGVMVFCEQRQGELMPTDFELVSEARKLADDLGNGEEVIGVVLGGKCRGMAKQIGGYGADKVIVCEDPRLENYTTDAYAEVICNVVREYKPEILLFGATNIGRDLAPRCAARLHTGLTADCTNLNVDTEKYIQFLRENSTIDVDKAKWIMRTRV